jgi:hypothetical protein
MDLYSCNAGHTMLSLNTFLLDCFWWFNASGSMQIFPQGRWCTQSRQALTMTLLHT